MPHDIIDSSHRDKQKIVARFAPNANPEHRQNLDENELNTLIATDVLAEGLNLQDCGMLINYDLHWNPVRLIQRFRRAEKTLQIFLIQCILSTAKAILQVTRKHAYEHSRPSRAEPTSFGETPTGDLRTPDIIGH